jgi:hypothetical protein
LTDHNEFKKPNQSSKIKSFARFSGLAFQMLVIIGLGSFGGVKLDEAYPNEYSVFTIICSLVSIAIAMYLVIRQASNFSKENDK